MADEEKEASESEASEGSISDSSDSYSSSESSESSESDYSESSSEPEESGKRVASGSRSSRAKSVAKSTTSVTTTTPGTKKRKPRSTASTGTQKKRKNDTRINNDEEIKALSELIFSAEQTEKVEQELRKSLTDCKRIKSKVKREMFANHLLDASQTHNFKLLITGFCRKLSFLVKDCNDGSLKGYRKAALSVAWMKSLSRFQIGKATQERMIIDRFLKEKEFDQEIVYEVLSVIHELVYNIVHTLIRSTREDAATESSEPVIAEESDETLYRYCGFALHRMIKLRRETLSEKKGRGAITDERRQRFEQELEILQGCVMKDKTNLPAPLRNLDEGNLTFPKPELIHWLKSVDCEVRTFATDANLRKYHKNFPRLCQDLVLNNEDLKLDFMLLLSSLLDPELTTSETLVADIFKELVSKVTNTRINEYLNAKSERDLKSQGKVVNTDDMLRPTLKSYAIQTKRKVT